MQIPFLTSLLAAIAKTNSTLHLHVQIYNCFNYTTNVYIYADSKVFKILSSMMDMDFNILKTTKHVSVDSSKWTSLPPKPSVYMRGAYILKRECGLGSCIPGPVGAAKRGTGRHRPPNSVRCFAQTCWRGKTRALYANWLFRQWRLFGAATVFLCYYLIIKHCFFNIGDEVSKSGAWW